MNNKRPHILLLEDDHELARLIQEYYKPKGYTFDWYTDPIEPLMALKKNPQPELKYSAILTDLQMPNMNGFNFMKEMNEISKSLPIILMSANGTVETAVEGIKSGAFNFVLKPLDFEHITTCLERAIEHHRLVIENTNLKNSIAAIMNSSSQSTQTQETFSVSIPSDRFLTLAEIQLKYIEFVFERSGNIRERTAKTLDIDRKTLYKRLLEIKQHTPSSVAAH